MIKLALVVSTFNDPTKLLCCLSSLAIQTVNDQFKIEIHIADNSDDESAARNTESICKMFDNVEYHKTTGGCYNAAQIVIKELKDVDWLGFPSSDSYYVPGYAITMLEAAVRLHADLVYCDCLYDPGLHGRGIYTILHTFPEKCWIDKTCFLVSRKVFKGFPPEKNDYRDGALIESLERKGLKLVKAKGVLVVHN